MYLAFIIQRMAAIGVPLGRMVVKNGKGQLQYINNGVCLAGSEIKFEQLSGIVAGRQKPFSKRLCNCLG